jgi:hypothetical protein
MLRSDADFGFGKLAGVGTYAKTEMQAGTEIHFDDSKWEAATGAA